MSVPSIAKHIPESLEHPCLYFNKSDLNRVREMCLKGSHAEVFSEKRQQLDALLNEPFPVPPPREQSYRNGVWEDSPVPPAPV